MVEYTHDTCFLCTVAVIDVTATVHQGSYTMYYEFFFSMTHLLDRQTVVRITSFLSGHHLAALATCGPRKRLESSIVGYSMDGQLDLVFATFVDSQKALNIGKKGRVSLVVGWDRGSTLQYEGVAMRIAPQKVALIAERHYSQVPSAAKYVDIQAQVLYRVSPSWIRLTDYHQDPWLCDEIGERGTFGVIKKIVHANQTKD
jgi:hypothetical protein